jgi:hypothetical protein
MNNGWNVTGAIAAQSSAHSRLERAIAEGRAVLIYMGNCHVTTCESIAAAKFWIGKSKKYRIVTETPRS